MAEMTEVKAKCPECGKKIVLDRHVKRGDWINCPHCQAGDLEVVSLNPPLLDWAYEGPELVGAVMEIALGPRVEAMVVLKVARNF
jgi:lysine biosynthesis protein LysW